MDSIFKKYLKVTEEQEKQLLAYADLLLEWNEKINLISRKDTESVLEKHILHSLGVHITKEIKPGFEVLDVGTGGGLPGIPLAIMNPDAKFTLVDSIQKKINATQDIAQRLGLKNVTCINARVETLPLQFDIITGRAVMRLFDFYKLTHKLLLKYGKYVLLKGGDLTQEIREFEKTSRLKVRKLHLNDYFSEPFFDTKFVLEIKKK